MKQILLKSMMLVLMLFVGMGAWAETQTKTFSFTSTTPTGWTNAATTAGVSGYAKMKSGEYVVTNDITTIIPEGSVLSSSLKANVSCGTFGTWDSNKKEVTITVALLDGDDNVLSSASYRKTSLGNSETTYVASDYPIEVALPLDPSLIAKLKVSFSLPVNTYVLRFKNLKLNYQTEVAGATKYPVTIIAPDNGTLTIKKGDVTVSTGDEFTAGTTLNVTCTPDEGYKFRNWQYKAGDAAWATKTTTFTYTMTAAATSFRANFDAKEEYTVNYNVNGAVISSENLYEGDELTFPEVSEIGGKVFRGWVKTSSVNPASEPSYEATKNVVASESTTYYAVFATKSGNGSDIVIDMDAVSKNNGEFSIACNKAEGATAPAYSSNECRLYASNTITISTSGSENITALALTFHKQGSKGYIETITSNVGDYVSGGVSTSGTDDKVDTWSGSAKSITLTAGSSGQRVFVSAVITTGTTTYSDFTTSIPPTEISISDAGYATFVAPCDLDFSEADVTAYAVTPNLAESKVTLSSVTEVPAGKAIVVKGTQGTHNVPAMASATDFDTALEASATATAYDDEYTYYYLGVVGGQVGFRPLAEGGSIAAGKCFFKVAKSSDAPMLTFSFDDEETGITSVESAAKNGQAFNLAGQRVNTNAKGIIIVNGKKYFNK